MQLFQTNRKPQQLSPVFKRITKIKGHLKSKSRKGVISPKLNKNVRKQKFKSRNRKAMLSRVKIVGPRWNRQFKIKHTANYHLKRNKSRANLLRKTRAKYISKADLWRVRKMIPYFKRRALKQRY